LREKLLMFLDEYSGTGVRIAVIDSGVHAAHPHVGGVAGGVGILEDGTVVDDYVDRLGHGTAVTAAIREKAPDAEIFVVKVFWNTLATDIRSLVRAIEEAADRGAAVINLSLGTAEMQHRARLDAVVAAAHLSGSHIVAATDDNGTRWLPGSLDTVIGVKADWTYDRHSYTVSAVEGRPILVASPFPRDIPGVARERNVRGVSFAVANASGFVARALEAWPGVDIARVFETLHEAACVSPSA
jgi:subtilisin family serine protease